VFKVCEPAAVAVVIAGFALLPLLLPPQEERTLIAMMASQQTAMDWTEDIFMIPPGTDAAKPACDAAFVPESAGSRGFFAATDTGA